MRLQEILEGQRFGGYSADQVKEMGDCAIVAMSHVTGLPWEDVFEQAKDSFGQYGMNSGGISRTMRALGWHMESYFRLPWFQNPGMTVQAAELWLRQNAPDVRLLAVINVRRVPHTIAFVDGKFHNVLGATRAKLNLVWICKPA